MDEDEATEIVDEYLKERSVAEVYDSVLIPALSLAERDRHQNRLDDEKEEFIYQTTKELIQDLGEPRSRYSLPPCPYPFVVFRQETVRTNSLASCLRSSSGRRDTTPKLSRSALQRTCLTN